MSKTYYTKDHEWIAVDGDTATMGITNYAQEQLGDLVFVELPETGKRFQQGDEAIVVESVKAASDVYMPVSGEVTAVNEALADDPALVNRSPEDEGWLVRIRIADASQLEGLLDLAGYQQTLE